MINKHLKQEYFDNTIEIIEKFHIVPYNKSFEDESGILAEPNYYLGPQFDSGYFRIKNSKKVFHYEDHVKRLDDYYNKNQIDKTKISYEDAIKDSKKKTIVCMGFHPRSWNVETLRINFFDKLFQDTELLDSMRKGDAFLYLYYGYEADNFYDPRKPGYPTYDLVFKKTIEDYQLPYNSMIIHSSNALGYVQHSEKHNKSLDCVKYIYETTYETQTFTCIKGDVDLDYTFDDYIKNCKKAPYKLLRVNRTHSDYRDMMLIYLYKSGFLKESLIEHNKFIWNKDTFKDAHQNTINHAFNLGLGDVIKYLKITDDDIKNIEKMIPLISSDIERNDLLPMADIYSNESIPHDIYKNTILSWVSTSLVHVEDQVFINSSTFNPMLYYHPIIYHSNPNTAYRLQKEGYLSYNWLYNEEKQDTYPFCPGRLAISISEVDSVMNLSKDDLIDKIYENKHILKFNREKLFTTDTVRRIINRLHSIIFKLEE